MKQLLGGILGVLIILALALYYKLPGNSTVSSGQPMLATTSITILHGSSTIPLRVELARTMQEQETGLSGRAGLAPNTGMLFVFTPPQVVNFWMKDMRFSLDLLFADADGTISTVDHDVAPDTYPQTFRPERPARFVLEVPAGFSAAHGIAIGDKIVVQ